MAEGYKKERKSINLAGVSNVSAAPSGRRQVGGGVNPTAADERTSDRPQESRTRSGRKSARRGGRRP